MSTSAQTSTALPALPAVVELGGRVAPDLADYVQRRLAVVLSHTGRAALHAHVRVVRHEDPARERPAVARASVQLAGRTVHVSAEGTTPREATDLLLDRLDQRIARVSRTRRGDRRPPAQLAPAPASSTDNPDNPDDAPAGTDTSSEDSTDTDEPSAARQP